MGDIDGDGNLDAVTTSWRLGNQFAWFQHPGTIDPKNEIMWVKHVIEDDVAETRTVSLGDINRDGRLDVLGTATKAGWWSGMRILEILPLRSGKDTSSTERAVRHMATWSTWMAMAILIS